MALEREGLGVEVWCRESRHPTLMSTNICRGWKHLFGDYDDRSLVCATGCCEWETHYSECELTHFLGNLVYEPKALVCCQAIHLLSASMRCSRCEMQYYHHCQSAWHWAVTFSKFWDGNRLVNVNMCIREWCESILHFSGPTHRMLLHFLWTSSFSSRKNVYSWLLICSGHMIA